MMGHCRLCSGTAQIFDIFHELLDNGEQLRLYILLATGIHIKRTDVVSKMVCHRCCEIAVKLHKYRTNAVANDKQLKEQYGQPYSAPITDQEELLRIASKIANEHSTACSGGSIVIVDSSSSLDDALKLLNVSVKKEDIESATEQSNSEPLLHSFNNNINDIRVPSDNRLRTPQGAFNKTVTKNGLPITSTSNDGTQHGSSIVSRVAVPPPQRKKEKYKHPSVKKVFKTYKDIILPENVFKSDIAPVVSLDDAEVSDWYQEQFKDIQQKLTSRSIIIKKVPKSSSPIHSIKHNETGSPKDKTINSAENSIVTSTKEPSPKPNILSLSHKKIKEKRIFRRVIVDTSDYDSDGEDRDETLPFNSDYQKENDVSQINLESTNLPTVNKETTTSKNNVEESSRKSKKNIARRSFTTNRKRSIPKDNIAIEVIPEKKKRIYSNKNAMAATNKVDLPKECPSDKKERKAIFTSSLELTPVEAPTELIDVETLPDPPDPNAPPELVDSGKKVSIFICRVCNKIKDSRKALKDHERTHLKCKFCSKRIKNLKLLTEHQNQSCFINIVKNLPVVRVTKVDCVPSIVKMYPDAFEKSKPDQATNSDYSTEFQCNESIDDFKVLHSIEEVVLPMPSDDNLFSESEEGVDNQGNMLVAQNDDSITENAEHEKNQNLEVVCISDDSDSEIQCMEVPRHKIVETPYAIPIDVTTEERLIESPGGSKYEHVTADSHIPASALAPQSYVSETEMIRCLFKKHWHPAARSDNNTQTFSFSNNNIKYTNTNLIILENMFSELSAYKIPVHLESQQRISANFKKAVAPPAASSLEYWAHKTAIDIRTTLPNRKPPPYPVKSNTAVVIKRLYTTNVSNGTPRVPNSLPISQNVSTSNVTPTGAKTYTLHPVSVATSTTSTNNLCSNFSTSNTPPTPNKLPCANNGGRICNNVKSNNPPPYRPPHVSHSVTSANVQIVETQNTSVVPYKSLPSSTNNPPASTKVVVQPQNSVIINQAPSTSVQNTQIVPFQAPLAFSQNSASLTLQAMISHSNAMVPYQPSSVVSHNTAVIPYQVQSVVSHNTAAIPYQLPSAVPQNRSAALEGLRTRITQNQLKQVYVKNYITNINQYMVTDTVQHTPMQTSDVRYKTSVNIVNNPPSHQQPLQLLELETTDQRLDVATTSSDTQSVQNNGTLRVKNVSELK